MWYIRWRFCLWTLIVIAGAVGIGKIVQVLTVEGGGPTGVDASSNNNDQFSEENRKDLKLPFNGTLATQTDQLVWFMQVSDLHLSIWMDPARTEQFRKFCQFAVPAISPTVVLASGDLTDAKSKNGMGSSQYVEEWRHYRDILQQTGLFNTTVWLDVRGNHDNFDLPSLSSPHNLFLTHSVQGRQHRRSYLHTLRTVGLRLAFVAVDATPLPGPKRPFNFVGILPPSEFQLLRHLAQEARQTHDHTIWFGHYPTSCIIEQTQDVEGVRGLMTGSVVYLCGHLHSLGGLVPAMYTRQHSGVLELELEDWKDGRMFRVMALDYGLFSFVDVKYDTWPVILITNPKHALYQQQTRESPGLSLASSHIRVLVWSLTQIERVALRIGDSDQWVEMRPVEGPLYVVEWNPNKYLIGLHKIKVLATDVDGREQVIEQPFSLDGSQPSFKFWPRVFLMSNISAVFQFLFGCSVCSVILVLCIFKYLHYTASRSKRKNICRSGIFRWKFIRAVVRKIWLLSAVDQIFWPLIIYMLYLPVGPWLVGELLDNQYGIVFAWGTFIYSSFLPGSLTFAYGFALVLTFLLPLIIGLAHCIDCRMHSLFLTPRSGLTYHSLKNLPLLLTLSMQTFSTYLMFLAYGWLSVLLGPIRSWSVVLGLVLWIQVEQLPASKLLSAANIWFGDQHRLVIPVLNEEESNSNLHEALSLTMKRKEDDNQNFSETSVDNVRLILDKSFQVKEEGVSANSESLAASDSDAVKAELSCHDPKPSTISGNNEPPNQVNSSLTMKQNGDCEDFLTLAATSTSPSL